jgi:hypothetical protein
MTKLTRGPLPARVYWVRRLMLLGIATLLVVGVARILGGSSDGSGGPDRVTTVADTGAPSVAPTTNGPAPNPTPTTEHSTGVSPHGGKQADDPVTQRAQPSGPCSADDVAVMPSVPNPVAGRDITVVLDLSTLRTPACTWTLSGDTLAMKITSGSDLIWTTVQCSRSIPTRDLVLRQGDPVRVKLTWDARRSEPGCPVQTAWALPGTYHLHVAALAGHPQDVTFLLTAPSPPEVTKTAHPKHHGGKKHPA